MSRSPLGNPRLQHLWGERLGYVIIGPGIKGLDQFVIRFVAGEHDYVHMLGDAGFAQNLTKIETDLIQASANR